MSVSGVNRTFATGVASLLVLVAPSSNAADDFPRDVLKGIEAMERLPVEGFHVVESQGRLLLISTNGHYVVTGGRLLDLWNNVEVRSVADISATTHIPLARMGIHAKKLGGVSFGKDAPAPAVTVFLDPASAESGKILPQLRTLANERRVDVVFVPAHPDRANVSRALICDARAAQAFLANGHKPSPLSDEERCGVEELQRARVTVQLLGIQNLPFSVAANGATMSGTSNEYHQFVKANGGSAP